MVHLGPVPHLGRAIGIGIALVVVFVILLVLSMFHTHMAAGTFPGTPPHRIHTAIFNNGIGTKGTTIGDRRGRLFGDGSRHVCYICWWGCFYIFHYLCGNAELEFLFFLFSSLFK